MRRGPAFSLMIVLALGGGAALAQETKADAVGEAAEAEARRAFALGVEHLERRDYDKALTKFREAYAGLPRPNILYNIGLTFERRGDPVQAVASYEKALAAGLKPKWEAKARAHLAAQQALLSEVSVRCNVDGARITVNDRLVGDAPVTAKVTHGRLIILADAPGYLTMAKSVQAKRGGRIHVPIDLKKADKPLANLSVDSKIVGADVYVDGMLVGVTPLDRTIGVTSGEPHGVTLRRPGYRDLDKTVASLHAGGTATVTLDPEVDRDAVDRAGARLKLNLKQPATVRIDGERYELDPDGLRLPPGPHVVRAELSGYDPLVRTIVLSPNRTTTTTLDLVMLEETRAAKIDAAYAQRVAGWSLIGGGLAVAGVGVGITIWNQGNVERWTDELERFENKQGIYAACGSSLTEQLQDDCLQAGEDLGDNVTLAQTYDGVGFALLAAGGLSAIAGSLVLVFADDPSAYELKVGDELDAITLQPRPFGLRGIF